MLATLCKQYLIFFPKMNSFGVIIVSPGVNEALLECEAVILH